MFIYSLRASTLKFVFVIFVSCAVILALALFVKPLDVETSAVELTTVKYSGLKTDGDRREFIKGFGYETKEEVSEVAEFVIPKEFDRILLGYNEIQKTQGLDLKRYQNRKVTRYTYEVTNYDGYDGKVYVNLIIYKNKLVAADVCSADPFGFVSPLIREG